MEEGWARRVEPEQTLFEQLRLTWRCFRQKPRFWLRLWILDLPRSV